MKFFFFILGSLMLYMSCLPCSDSNECNEKAPIEVSATDNHQEHSHDEESCTPFCTCSCCAFPVFSANFFKIPATNFFPQSEKHLLSNVSFNTEVYCSIWQPPKIG